MTTWIVTTWKTIKLNKPKQKDTTLSDMTNTALMCGI